MVLIFLVAFTVFKLLIISDDFEPLALKVIKGILFFSGVVAWGLLKNNP
jgi:hypothetical protein